MYFSYSTIRKKLLKSKPDGDEELDPPTESPHNKEIVPTTKSDESYEDRDDLPLTPKEQTESNKISEIKPVAKIEEEKSSKISNTDEMNTVSQYESIESIIYYLEMEYGLEKFKEIYQIVKEIDEKQKGEIQVDEYLEHLVGIVEPDKILRNLFLFLSLKRAEEQAISV